MTTLDVEQMKFSGNDFINAQMWLENFMMGDTQDAAHARAIYSFSAGMANAILVQSSYPVDSGNCNISYTLPPTDLNTFRNKHGD
jgi:hypothetical protein